MITKLISSLVGIILTPLAAVLDFAGIDLTAAVSAASSIVPYLATGYSFMKIFIPTLDACLSLALLCVAANGIYHGYLVVMWILKKLPMVGIS